MTTHPTTSCHEMMCCTRAGTRRMIKRRMISKRTIFPRPGPCSRTQVQRLLDELKRGNSEADWGGRKAVGHEHDITCNPEIEPYWEPPEGMTRKDIVAADKAKMVDHRQYKRRLVYDYRIGKGKGYSVKTREHPNHSEEVHKFQAAPLHFE